MELSQLATLANCLLLSCTCHSALFVRCCNSGLINGAFNNEVSFVLSGEKQLISMGIFVIKKAFSHERGGKMLYKCVCV